MGVRAPVRDTGLPFTWKIGSLLMVYSGSARWRHRSSRSTVDGNTQICKIKADLFFYFFYHIQNLSEICEVTTQFENHGPPAIRVDLPAFIILSVNTIIMLGLDVDLGDQPWTVIFAKKLNHGLDFNLCWIWQIGCLLYTQTIQTIHLKGLYIFAQVICHLICKLWDFLKRPSAQLFTDTIFVIIKTKTRPLRPKNSR